mgnify:CR=1 FL=1
MGRLNAPNAPYAPPCLAALLLSFFLQPGCTGPAGPDWREAERVVDGDTLALAGGERVRLLGIDAPLNMIKNPDYDKCIMKRVWSRPDAAN